MLTDTEALVHVTGHPRRDELKEMYAWVKPKVAMPMHGEARHLKEHARLARAQGVPNVHPVLNGEILRLAPDPADHRRRSGRPPLSRWPADRRRRGGAACASGVRSSFVGIVIVALALSRKGDVMSQPQVVIDGVPAATADGAPMVELVAEAGAGHLRSIPPQRRREAEMVREAVAPLRARGHQRGLGQEADCQSDDQCDRS